MDDLWLGGCSLLLHDINWPQAIGSFLISFFGTLAGFAIVGRRR